MPRAAAARAEPAPSRRTAPPPRKRSRPPARPGGRVSRRGDRVSTTLRSFGGERRSTPATGPARSPARALARIADAATSTLIDRLLRGRIWVGCIGFLLAGIVGLNVSLLQLNQEIARTTTKATALDRQNSRLRAEVAALDSSERIQSLAERRGMVMPAPGQFRYLRARPWLDAELAARRVVAPEPPAPPAAPPTQVAQAPVTTAPQVTPTTTVAPQAQAQPTAPATTTPAPTPTAQPPAAVATP